MATDAEVRKWAREQQLDGIPERGRMPAEMHEQYDEAHAGADYQGGTSAADFVSADVPGADEFGDGLPGAAAVVVPAERPPQPLPRPPIGQAVTKAAARWGIGPGASGQGKGSAGRQPPRKRKRKPKVVHARLPIDSMLSRGWRNAAKWAQGAPPISRLLYAQAPYAGMVLDDVVRDTIVDRALQPVVRLQDKADAVSGLLAPGFVAGLMAVGEDHFATDFLLGGLRHSLKMWFQVSQTKAEQVIADAVEEAVLDDEVEKIIRWIFAPPPGAQPQPPQPDRPDPRAQAGAVFPAGTSAPAG